MKVEKALEILNLNVCKRRPDMPRDVLDALKLGIEALRRNLNCRNKGNCEYARDLPGETKE